MIYKKALLLYGQVADMAPLPLDPVRRSCLLIYSISILFIFLWKYNCKIVHKSKSNGNYTKLTN